MVLHPLTISRTDLGENPHPLGVVWAGPLLGLAIPLSLWACATWFRLPEASVLRFFAGFCLIANGLYISLGSVDQVGDCREMLRHGSSPWQLWLFGVVSVPIGFYLWHGQGRHFGWGPNPTPINSRVAYGSLVVFLTLLASGFFLEFRG